jgi:hypothetical protein
LAAQSDSQHVVRSGQAGIQSYGLTKFCGRLFQFAALSFYHAQFQVSRRSGFEPYSQPQFALSIAEILLLGKNSA